MQPKAGDSRESMTRYLEKLDEINRKMDEGAYGQPTVGSGEVIRPAYYDRMSPEEQQAWDEDH
jgi:hypothetical protein